MKSPGIEDLNRAETRAVEGEKKKQWKPQASLEILIFFLFAKTFWT
jgi:hypothetical protein